MVGREDYYNLHKLTDKRLLLETGEWMLPFV